MITKYSFVCEICGKEFEDDTECERHEFAHSLSNAEGALHIFDSKGKPMKFDLESTDTADIWFVKWDNKEAWEVMDKIFDEFGNGYGFYNATTVYADRRDGGMAFYNSHTEQWEMVDRILEQADQIRYVMEQGG